MKERGERIKIVWRANFEQPKGPLNPGAFKIAGPVEVEIRQANGEAACFRPGTNSEFAAVTRQPTAESLKRQMLLFFERQLTNWQSWEVTGAGDSKPIQPDQFYTDELGKSYRKEKR